MASLPYDTAQPEGQSGTSLPTLLPAAQIGQRNIDHRHVGFGHSKPTFLKKVLQIVVRFFFPAQDHKRLHC